MSTTSRVYAIDGCNVAFWRRKPSDPASLVPLLRIVNAIVAQGESFYCVFDASIKRHLEKSGDTREIEILDELIANYSENFLRITASTVADDVICKWADQRQCGVITNDLYRNLEGQYEWVSSHSDRLIQGNLLSDGTMIIKKLPYDVFDNASLERLYNDFKSAIDKNSSDSIGPALPLRQDHSETQFNFYRTGRWRPASDRSPILSWHSEGSEAQKNHVGRDLNPELEYIQRARSELGLFLSQYGSHIGFDGFTWDVASKRFLEFFNGKMVCSCCWSVHRIQSNFDRYLDNGVCCNCGKASVTTRPAKLLEIINRHVPPGKFLLSYDIPDCAVEAGHVMRAKSELRQFFTNKSSGMEQTGVPFSGDSWDMATRSFLDHFAWNAICVKCWRTTSLAKERSLLKTIKAYETDQDFLSIVGDDLKCCHCGKKSATPRPKALIDIVNNNKPDWKNELLFIDYKAKVLPVAARVAKGLFVSLLSRYS